MRLMGRLFGLFRSHPISLGFSLAMFTFFGFIFGSYSNFSGFCKAQDVRLTDEQIVSAAVAREIKIHDAIASQAIDEGERPNDYPLSYSKIEEAVFVRYASVQDFLAANPNCCLLIRRVSGWSKESSYLAAFFGYYFSRVELIYKKYTAGERQMRRVIHIIDACGYSVDRRGG